MLEAALRFLSGQAHARTHTELRVVDSRDAWSRGVGTRIENETLFVHHAPMRGCCLGDAAKLLCASH
jgi:hypothetical protein